MSKRLTFFFALLLGASALPVHGFQPDRTRPVPQVLWYRQPAWQPEGTPYGQKPPGPHQGWVEALPVGNGRMGAMVFGGTRRERIQLNEESVWDGYQSDRNNPEALKALPEVRRLIFAGKNEEATQLAGQSLMGVPTSRVKSYQPLGDLFIEFPGLPETVSGYSRDLSLDSALARVRFKAGGIGYSREVFASHPDGIIVVRLAADKRGSITARISLTREGNDHSVASVKGTHRLLLQGQTPATDPSGRKTGIRFTGGVQAVAKGGRVSNQDGVITVTGADEVLLLISAATSYGGKDPERTSRERLERAAAKSYPALRQAHLRDHQALFGRVALQLGEAADPFALSTPERLEKVRAGGSDDYLSALHFQYGRYLLIACSRPGDLPANLQGVWNDKMTAPWQSDYHTNINLQMNYWPAEVAGLPECHLPLFALMDSLAVHGARTAKVHYGARGWVVHHLTDLFWYTPPADGVHGVWPVGGAWLARHPWEHFLYSRDAKFLRERGYPLMKGAAEFMLDFLVEVPAGLPMAGKLVTNPSHSPENRFRKADGTESMFTYGATMDLQITRELFTHCLEAIAVLGKDQPFDAAFKGELEKALSRLAPVQVSPNTGRIQEWMEDYAEPEPGHRHMSHLYGLYPANQISPRRTPELVGAARKSLEARLNTNGTGISSGGGTGWSRSWLTLFYARLLDRQEAYKHHQALLARFMLPNLFGDHPPFQIDANFSGAAGVAEMLLQSHEDELSLLPALPPQWASGRVQGLRGRGGYTVDLQWGDGRLAQADIHASGNGTCRVRTGGPVRVTLNGKAVESRPAGEGVVTFAVAAGKTYRLAAAR